MAANLDIFDPRDQSREEPFYIDGELLYDVAFVVMGPVLDPVNDGRFDLLVRAETWDYRPYVRRFTPADTPTVHSGRDAEEAHTYDQNAVNRYIEARGYRS